jgi:hypothetical protein
MSATVQNVIDQVRYTIHDETPATYRWTDAELIAYVNAASRQIVSIVPEANLTTSIITITNTIAKQALPTGGIKFVKVLNNVSPADGTTIEGAVRQVEKDALDSYDPDWEYDTTIKTVAAATDFFDHYCHDPRDKKAFYVYPPGSTTVYANVQYSAVPTFLTVVGDTIPLTDEYLEAYYAYVTYRSLTKESRDTLPAAYRQELWNNFLSALGQKLQADQRVSPEQNLPPEAP